MFKIKLSVYVKYVGNNEYQFNVKITIARSFLNVIVFSNNYFECNYTGNLMFLLLLISLKTLFSVSVRFGDILNLKRIIKNKTVPRSRNTKRNYGIK